MAKMKDAARFVVGSGNRRRDVAKEVAPSILRAKIRRHRHTKETRKTGA